MFGVRNHKNKAVFVLLMVFICQISAVIVPTPFLNTITITDSLANIKKTILDILKAPNILFNGQGNNIVNPNHNSAGASFRRLVENGYQDGSQQVIEGPNPRKISNIVGAQADNPLPEQERLNTLFTIFGQFIDHDLDLSGTQSKTNPASEFININIPASDQTFGPNARKDPKDTSPDAPGTVQIVLTRSNFTPNEFPRIPFNRITGWIDASNIYGSTFAEANNLRSFTGGKLKATTQPGGGDFLPKDASGTFFAGDPRANENVILAIVHTIWVREHNRICDEIAKDNSVVLTDQQLYTVARKIVTGILSKIIYDDWLPKLIGTQLHAEMIGEYTGYDGQVDARIPIEFANAAFRIGHPLLVSNFPQINETGGVAGPSFALADLFGKSSILNNKLPIVNGQTNNNTIFQNLLRGVIRISAKEKDCTIIDDVRNFLVEGTNPKADLYAINIQRGRQTGVPNYNRLRVALGLTSLSSFSSMTDASSAGKLQSVYDSYQQLDPWVGIICENPLPQAVLGRVGAEIVARTFADLRRGDRFWYENSIPSAIVKIIKATTFADIIKRNTNILNIPDDVFRKPL